MIHRCQIWLRWSCRSDKILFGLAKELRSPLFTLHVLQWGLFGAELWLTYRFIWQNWCVRCCNFLGSGPAIFNRLWCLTLSPEVLEATIVTCDSCCYRGASNLFLLDGELRFHQLFRWIAQSLGWFLGDAAWFGCHTNVWSFWLNCHVAMLIRTCLGHQPLVQLMQALLLDALLDLDIASLSSRQSEHTREIRCLVIWWIIWRGQSFDLSLDLSGDGGWLGKDVRWLT